MGLPVHGSGDWFGSDSDHAVVVLAPSDRPSDDSRRNRRRRTGTNQLAHRVVDSTGRSR